MSNLSPAEYADRGFPLDWDELQEKTLKRDDFRCRECGRQTELFVLFDEHPHEREDGFQVSNLITLCVTHAPDAAQMNETAITESFRDEWVQERLERQS
ncbi:MULTISPECIES: HNH endonuclease [unclassified Haloarcula]|uniref:HNH endonuclease n=1 Tax=unclassified Haloarcula TaxID=2624677 RepID=UPI000EF1AFDF|nr:MULTISPECIES: hypothetical protein [unclassified Haloarcula]RLM37201.1 hypothetical protein DVK01_11420 [Haloarcula sp. Atlit-120R]RLM44410.1 hypothetical protein DVK00_08045 [Haloarcula sp. Atlit-47R]